MKLRLLTDRRTQHVVIHDRRILRGRLVRFPRFHVKHVYQVLTAESGYCTRYPRIAPTVGNFGVRDRRLD